MSEQFVTCELEVSITVNDPDVFERVTGPKGDEWRAQLYNGVHTKEDVLKHLAAAGVMPGAERANQLEGWADLPNDAATMEIVGVEATDVRE